MCRRDMDAVATSAFDVGPQRARVELDLHVDLVGLREHRNRRRAGVDAALALGLGYALHAVRATLVLQ